MNKEAQRIAIAEACGWTKIENRCISHGYTSLTGKHPDSRAKATKVIPDFLNDLNAMHEAEKFIKQDEPVWVAYYDMLAEEVMKVLDDSDVVHATAAQRAEAFLKTLGLWKEEAPPQL